MPLFRCWASESPSSPDRAAVLFSRGGTMSETMPTTGCRRLHADRLLTVLASAPGRPWGDDMAHLEDCHGGDDPASTPGPPSRQSGHRLGCRLRQSIQSVRAPRSPTILRPWRDCPGLLVSATAIQTVPPPKPCSPDARSREHPKDGEHHRPYRDRCRNRGSVATMRRVLSAFAAGSRCSPVRQYELKWVI
jgi:hypothetical protein